MSSIEKCSGRLLLIVFLATFCFGEAFGDQTLWYSQPSTQFKDGITLGNGRLGMVVNGTADEHIVFNENSIWSGWYEEDQDRVGSFTALQELLRAVQNGGAGRPKLVALGGKDLLGVRCIAGYVVRRRRRLASWRR